MPADSFDQDYYDRFYRDPDTAVATADSTARLANFVCSYLAHMDLPVRTVLDLGCGLGFWRQPVLEHFPKARYTGVEVSAYTCAELGWTQGSVLDYRPKKPADLVICQGVLQYLNDRDCRTALDNLAAVTSGVLYLEALTEEDWETNCDQSLTDGAVHLRKGEFYRRRLARSFINCGGGVFLARTADVALFELERLA